MSEGPLTFTAGGGDAGDGVVPATSDEITEGAPAADAGDVAAAEGGLAARLRTKQDELRQRTKRIEMPPDDVWDGDLVLVVKPAKLKKNLKFVELVIQATERLEMLNPDTGDFEEIPDGWTGIGRLMGLDGDRVTLGQIVLAVCSSEEVLAGLVEQILAFIAGRASQIEQALGE